MNSTILFNSARFFLLLALQIVILNNINLFGYINPLPYVLFIILYPVNANKNVLLIASFFLGLIMDMFLNSGGVHAASCVLIAFLRPFLFRFSFGLSYEYQTVRLNDVLTPERFSFIFLAVIIHHLTLFFLELFSVEFYYEIIIRTLASTIFTILSCILIIYLIRPNKQR